MGTDQTEFGHKHLTAKKELGHFHSSPPHPNPFANLPDIFLKKNYDRTGQGTVQEQVSKQSYLSKSKDWIYLVFKGFYLFQTKH